MGDPRADRAEPERIALKRETGGSIRTISKHVNTGGVLSVTLGLVAVTNRLKMCKLPGGSLRT